ncbi:MAG: SurA N-terminal domain-containing protein [Kiritimatiellae bacterium]|nr:SurA N-terminal domain-containing protein [Kiritimatiellia bacterium]
MVIQKFNKLIRNKWIWGVFAVAISAFFAFDFLIADLNAPSDRGGGSGAGTIAGEKVDAALFEALADDVRGIGRNRDWKTDQAEVNRAAWENYAALLVAERAGISVSDDEVSEMIRRDPSFQQNGAFSFPLYSALLAENSITPERFEASLKRRMTLARLAQSVLGAATWCSPMELDQAVADMTDTYTVRVASFRQERKDSDAVKLDDEGLRKWYDANTNSIALPERFKLRMVRYDATDTNVLARMTVTEDEMRDRYDVTSDKYTVTDTNGVEKVKEFEEVKGRIERELRQIAAVEFFRTNLNARAYGTKAADGTSRLDEIAKEDGLKVDTTGFISIVGPQVDGFMTRASLVFPGAENLDETLAELDSSSEDLRYGVVASDRAVWLVEKDEVSPAHVPTFEEAKDAIRPRALRDARADAFKASVEALAAKGTNELFAAAKDVTTNLTFSVTDLRQGEFNDQLSVVRASMRTMKGELSEFTPTSPSRGIVVYCVDRVPGDAAKAMLLKAQVRGEVSSLQLRQVPDAWKKWNLERMGFEPGERSSVERAESEE